MHLAAGFHDLAVALARNRPIRDDLEFADAQPFKCWSFTPASEDGEGESEPSDPAARRHHQHVEKAVVGLGVWHEWQVALEMANVADQYAHASAGNDRAIGGVQCDAKSRIAQVPDGADNIGEPPDS